MSRYVENPTGAKAMNFCYATAITRTKLDAINCAWGSKSRLRVTGSALNVSTKRVRWQTTRTQPSLRKHQLQQRDSELAFRFTIAAAATHRIAILVKR